MGYYNTWQRQNNQNFGFAPNTQAPQFDINQFRQFAITLNDNNLQQLAQLARQKGISENDIQTGIKLIKSL